MNLVSKERKEFLNIIWAWNKITEEEIICYKNVIAELHNSGIVQNKEITHINEFIRDMRILISKKNKITEILFNSNDLSRIDYLIKDFFEVKSQLQSKRELTENILDSLIQSLSFS